MYGSVERTLKKIDDGLEELDILLNYRNWTPTEEERRNILIHELWQKEQQIMWRQESRISWLKEGEKNTRFFHIFAKFCGNKKPIKGLTIENEWCEDPILVKEEVFNHFDRIFGVSSFEEVCLDELDFLKLNQSSRGVLEQSFPREEIKLAVDQCDGSKAPGPDGGWSISVDDSVS